MPGDSANSATRFYGALAAICAAIVGAALLVRSGRDSAPSTMGDQVFVPGIPVGQPPAPQPPARALDIRYSVSDPGLAGALGLAPLLLPDVVTVDTSEGDGVGYDRIRTSPSVLIDSNRVDGGYRVANGAQLRVLEQRCGDDDGQWIRARVETNPSGSLSNAALPGAEGWFPVQSVTPHAWGCCAGRAWDCTPAFAGEAVGYEHVTPSVSLAVVEASELTVRATPIRDVRHDNDLLNLPRGTFVSIVDEVCAHSGYRWARVTGVRNGVPFDGWSVRHLIDPAPNPCCRGRENYDQQTCLPDAED